MKHLILATAAEPADKPPTFDELYRAHMAEMGAKGGKVSGARRKDNVSAAKRRQIAKKAAAARWNRPGR
jgi:hypothetical protein